MWLINTSSLELKEFQGKPPPYAILSHTWGDEEVSFQDWQHGPPLDSTKAGFEKIRRCCQIARGMSLRYLWCDTNCIDKKSSAELSEAINSMYAWYRDAQVCIAYLSDFGPGKAFEDGAMESRWWTRGWTLQELIAPSSVLFHDKDWSSLGDRRQLADQIKSTTGIPSMILSDPTKVKHTSIAQRMSWVAYRQTTRAEDMAYCMLGIFDINMPLLYGEGDKAFIRLQEEIMRTSNDQSLFFWHWDPSYVPTDWASIMAPAPQVFALSSIHETAAVARDPYSMTNAGIEISMEVVRIAGTPLQDPHYLIRFPGSSFSFGFIACTPAAPEENETLERCSYPPSPFPMIQHGGRPSLFLRRTCRFSSSRQAKAFGYGAKPGVRWYSPGKSGKLPMYYREHRVLILDPAAVPGDHRTRGTRRLVWPRTAGGILSLEYLYSRDGTAVFGNVVEFEVSHPAGESRLQIFIGIRVRERRVVEAIYRALPPSKSHANEKARMIQTELKHNEERVESLMAPETALSVLRCGRRASDMWTTEHRAGPSNIFTFSDGSRMTCDFTLDWPSWGDDRYAPLILSPSPARIEDDL